MREHLRQFQANIAERITDLALASKERWESQIAQMKADGYEIPEGVTYESVKEFHERKEYKIEVAREWHIKMEFVGMDAILPCLFERQWILARRAHGAGPFVTADRPVVLVWKNPEAIPALFRHSPGYGMRDTVVYFPLSQDVGLVGMFEETGGVIDAGEEYVAHQNTLMMHKAYRRIYSPKVEFPFVGQDGQVLTGRDLLSGWRNIRRT